MYNFSAKAVLPTQQQQKKKKKLHICFCFFYFYLTWSELVYVQLCCAAGLTVTPIWLEPLWSFGCVVMGLTCRNRRATLFLTIQVVASMLAAL